MSKFYNQLIREKIGKQLLSIRQAQGLTIEQVTKQSKISPEMIDVIEKGGNVGITKIRTLAKYYGKRIKFILVDL